MPWFFYLGSMGPALGAISATIVLRADGGVGAWARGAFTFTGIGRSLIVVIVSIALHVGVGILVEHLATGSIAKLPSVGLTTQIPGASALLVAVTWFLTFGLGEETGWRGWLMPTLTTRFRIFPAALMVAGVWLVWHLPQLLFNTEFRAMGWATIGWAVALVAGSSWCRQRSSSFSGAGYVPEGSGSHEYAQTVPRRPARRLGRRLDLTSRSTGSSL